MTIFPSKEDAALLLMRRFHDGEIAKIFTVPASRMEHLEARTFQGDELAYLKRLPAPWTVGALTHTSGPDSPDPGVAMSETEKMGKKE